MNTSKLVKEINDRGKLHRSAVITKAAINKEERTVNIAFSSEEPYQRWFGLETLGHKTGEVDLSFIGSGSAPFLDGHDPSKQIGVIEKAWIDQDKKGRAVVRFSKNQAADEIFKDILDGIRKNISVGYEVGSMVLVSEHDDDGKSYRVDGWTPLEASSVSIPADRTVGVGRENSPSQKVKSSRSQKMNEKNIQNEIREKELHRIKELTALGNHKAGDFKDHAERAITNGTSIEDFRAFVIKEMDKKEDLFNINMDPDIFSHNRSQEPSTPIMDAIRSQLPGVKNSYNAGAALEKSQELSRQFEKKPQGVFIELGSRQTRTLETNVGSSSGYLVATDLLGSHLIDYLSNASLVTEFGATVLSDLVGDVDIPRVDATATSYYVGESGDITDSDQTLGQIRMTPHTLGARTTISRRTMLQSSIAMEQFVRNDLIKLLSTGMDAAAINGTGADGQPRGILNTTGIGSVTLNATSTPDWGDIVGLETEISTDNALAGSLAYMTNPTILGNLKITEKSSSTAKFLLDEGKLNGYQCGVTNNMPAKHILFGNWADLIIGMWGAIDVLVDPFTNSSSGQLNITAFIDFDIAVKHPESFADGYKA